MKKNEPIMTGQNIIVEARRRNSGLGSNNGAKKEREMTKVN
jgi:hypothetical protein